MSSAWRVAAVFSAAIAIAGCDSSPAVTTNGPVAASDRGAVSAVSAVSSPVGVPPSPLVSQAAGSTAISRALPTPLTVLEIGDSLGEDLGFGLHDVLRDVHGIELVQAAKGNSGLAQPQYYDWPKHLSQLVAERRPDVVVVFLGANDVQDFYADGVLEHFGTPGWQREYAQRVAVMMQTATGAGAKMLWVGMPIMRSAAFSSSIEKLNQIYQTQAALHPGVSYLPSWGLFTDAAGKYVTTAKVDEKLVTLRTPDGVHITFGNGGGGADMLAASVVDALTRLSAG